VTANGRGPAVLHKGAILQEADVVKLAAAGLQSVHVITIEPGEIHEDEAARRLARVVAGPGTVARGPVESQMRLVAERNGLLVVDTAALERLNSIPDISIFTLYDGQLVGEGKTVAGVKVTPFVVPEARVQEAEAEARRRGGVVRVLAFQPMRVGVLVRERLAPRQREKFETAIQRKIAWFGSTIAALRFVADDQEAVAGALRELVAQCDLLLTAGANATDPLDPTLLALQEVGARIEKQGAPAHPGSAVWLAYLGEVPIFGVAACGMFSKATVLDLLLPKFFAGVRVRASDFNSLGHGGLLSKDMAFRFPPYGEFEAKDEL
jgi:molybdopterin biosynthesis enzyme